MIRLHPTQATCAHTAGGRERGFTLVELMVTLVVAVVLIAIAVPSFHTMIVSNKLTTAANDVVNAVAVARMEAIKRNAPTQLCSNVAADNTNGNTVSVLGTACGTETGAVYALTGATGTPTAIRVSAGSVGIVAPLQLAADFAPLQFDSLGQAHKVGDTAPFGNTIADICTDSISTDNHRVITMTAGTIVTTATTTGGCP